MRVAFQLDAALRDRFAACLQSSLPAGAAVPNLSILNDKQFVVLSFESVDDAYIFAETVNRWCPRRD